MNKTNENMLEAKDYVSPTRKLYTEKATDFLAHKNRQPHYLVTYCDDPETNNEVKILKPLTDENIAEVKAFIDAYINKAYAEEIEAGDEINDAWRNDVVAEAIGELSDKDYLCNTNVILQNMEIIDIDLNSKYYCYRTKVAIFPNGMTNTPRVINVDMNLPDNVYLYLLVEFMLNPNMSLNKLRTKNQDIYERVSAYVDNFFHGCVYPCNVPTYAVEFTEIIEDAQTLLKNIESNIK